MEKFETICENREFRRIYARGKAYVSPVVVVYTMKNRSHQLRVGITTTKKIGNAVKRLLVLLELALHIVQFGLCIV